jgi:amino acid transporter
VQRHRVEFFHALWVLVALAFVVEAAVLADSLEDSQAFLAFGVTAVVWGVLGCVLGLHASPPTTGAEQGRLARARERGLPVLRRPTAPRGPMPWRWPWVAAYVLGVPVLVLLAGAVATASWSTAAEQTAVWAFCALLGWLVGLAAALLAVVFWLVLLGVVAFGRPALTGRVGEERVPRAPYVGPFVALLGLLPLPAVLAGAASYDSPRRRDLLPLVGAVRDDVDVTHPALLLVSQVATWWLLGGLAVGAAITWWAASRARGAAQQQPDA